MIQYSANVKEMLDQKCATVMKPKEYVHEVYSDFDKLRKRVNYLNNGKRSATTRPIIPDFRQVHSSFLREDEERREQRKSIDHDNNDEQGDDSDSDDSIRLIKLNHNKVKPKIELGKLSDEQIAKLTMQQISNLVVEPSVLSNVPKNLQKEVMETEWLKPIKTYFPGDSFGERALYEGIDYRAG